MPPRTPCHSPTWPPAFIISLHRAAAPKLSTLQHLTTTSPLAQLVLFSSVASLVGAAGQASYVSANAGLDALAQQRAAAGEVGAAGQASYVLANAGLDALAQQRAAAGEVGSAGQAGYVSVNAGLDAEGSCR